MTHFNLVAVCRQQPGEGVAHDDGFGVSRVGDYLVDRVERELVQLLQPIAPWTVRTPRQVVLCAVEPPQHHAPLRAGAFGHGAVDELVLRENDGVRIVATVVPVGRKPNNLPRLPSCAQVGYLLGLPPPSRRAMRAGAGQWVLADAPRTLGLADDVGIALVAQAAEAPVGGLRPVHGCGAGATSSHERRHGGKEPVDHLLQLEVGSAGLEPRKARVDAGLMTDHSMIEYAPGKLARRAMLVDPQRRRRPEKDSQEKADHCRAQQILSLDHSRHFCTRRIGA
jgi:hypothetical protein